MRATLIATVTALSLATPVLAQGTPSARQADTQFQDRALTNHCVESGAVKEVCLCTTLVLKHELSLADYTALAKRVSPGETPRFMPASIETRLTPPPGMDPVVRAVADAPELKRDCRTARRGIERAQRRR